MDQRLTRRLLAGIPVLALLALLFSALFLAGDAETADSRLGRWSPWLFGGALAAVLILLVTIARQLWVLLRERRARAAGARLASRLTLALILLAVPPVLLVYGFAIKFLNGTIDSWFDVRIERAFDDALGLGRAYLDERMTRARARLAELAPRVATANRAELQGVLDTAIDAPESTAAQFAVLREDGFSLAFAAADPNFLDVEAPSADLLRQVRQSGFHAAGESLDQRFYIRAIERMADAGGTVYVQGIFPLPQAQQALARNVEASYHDYQRLAFLRESLKLTFTLILSAVLLLSLLLAVLAAIAMARRQVAPVARLAAATTEIAAGRFGGQIERAGEDELGFLTDAFNRMSRELAAAGARAEHSQAETERQRAYLQTVLERLSSGVLTIRADHCLRSANRAAGVILGVDLSAHVDHSLTELRTQLPALAPLFDLLGARLTDGVPEWREELLLAREDGKQALLLRAATLPAHDASLREIVVVFDDQTVFNQAQREAAWSEVARRLAHEVKNPLTPIQLAAERLQHRLSGKLPADDAAVLAKATGTIVAQVEALKSLVNAFGDYTRPAQSRMQPLKLNALIDNVLDLYENEAQLAIERTLDARDPTIRGDAGRLRQLLHNLLKNAIEASGATPRVQIGTHVDGAQVELRIADRGAGLPAGFDDSWFEPYRTNKTKGTGLGLAIVKKVAEEHGGSVRAEPNPEGGACFRVRLPLAQA
jgi:nitrogen fixation/metabolism regulation signal transduction histidine kinase